MNQAEMRLINYPVIYLHEYRAPIQAPVAEVQPDGTVLVARKDPAPRFKIPAPKVRS